MMRPEDVSRLNPIKRIGDDQKPLSSSPNQSFESYMDKAAGQMGTGKASNVSPFDIVATTPLAKGASIDTLLTQMKSAHGMLGDINTNLQQPKLKLKSSERYILRNKLSDANTNIRAAHAKLGEEAPPPPPPSSAGGVVGKFLDFISEGQMNLKSAQEHLQKIQQSGESMKPADFLAVQIKVAAAQQQIEFCSIMLANAVKDLQAAMNVQL
jgi:hypothetical protein